MTRAEVVLELSVNPPFNRLTGLLAREYFIEFRLCESLKLYMNVYVCLFVSVLSG